MREHPSSADAARLPGDAQPRAGLPVVALVLWALIAFAVPAISQALDLVDVLAFPLGYFMIAQGALIGFVLIGIASARWQDGRDKRLAKRQRAAGH